MVGLNIKKELIISLVNRRDITEIKKLKKELLLSDLRNSGLLKRINELREELNINLDYISINEELKQLKEEYSSLIKSLEIAKIESSNATLILKHANERNYILQEKYKLLKIELAEIKLNNHNICSICCENKINVCCIPCGHTYCDKCICEPHNNNCYICRQNFYRILKIYI